MSRIVTCDLQTAAWWTLVFFGLAVRPGFSEPPSVPTAVDEVQRTQLESKAQQLTQQALVHFHQKKDAASAARLLEESLAIRRRLYLKSQFPAGHVRLAESLNGLGVMLLHQEDYDRATQLLQQAHAMRERLCPVSRFPNGHSDLIQSMHNLGGLYSQQHDFRRAIDSFKQSLTMMYRLYPDRRYPPNFPGPALVLSHLASAYRAQGEYLRARICLSTLR